MDNEDIKTVLKGFRLETEVTEARYGMDGGITTKLYFGNELITETQFDGDDIGRILPDRDYQ